MFRFIGLATAHGVVTGGSVLVAWGFVLACFAVVIVSNAIPMCPAIIAIVLPGSGSSQAIVPERHILFFGGREVVVEVH